jgi:hypothetical protein
MGTVHYLTRQKKASRSTGRVVDARSTSNGRRENGVQAQPPKASATVFNFRRARLRKLLSLGGKITRVGPTQPRQ